MKNQNQHISINQMIKESGVSKYLELISSLAHNRRYNNNRSTKHRNASEGKHSIQNFVSTNPILDKVRASMDSDYCKQSQIVFHDQLMSTGIKNNNSDGDLVPKSQTRNNLYQIYCEEMRKKRKQNRNVLVNEKNKNNTYIVDISHKISLEDEKLEIIRKFQKSKSFKLEAENNKKKNERIYRKSKKKIQPGQLNILPIGKLRMPKIQRKNGISQIRTAIKFSSAFKSTKFKDQQKSLPFNRLEGWDARQQQSSFSKFYFNCQVYQNNYFEGSVRY